jgi:hypothetical protein
MNITRHKLKYYPFPREKDRREYVIGEAFLRDKRMPEDELATLQNVHNDPPDLVVNIKDYGQLGIEVTEAVPHDRGAINQANKFLKKLRNQLKGLGTRPKTPLNICLCRDEFRMPKIKEKEIVDIANWINAYCKQPAFPKVNTRIHDDTSPFKIQISSIAPSAKYKIGNPPIRISVIPATDAFAYPTSRYQNNLFLQDVTGFPIDYEETKKCIDERIKKKGVVNYRADILIIYAILGMLGFQGISEEIKNNLLCNLSFSGIYILQITHGKNDYIVNITTVKEHPKFEVKNYIKG